MMARRSDRYENPWPDAEPRGLKDFLHWRFVERRSNHRVPDPSPGSLPRRQPVIVYPRAEPGYRSITWVGHSTVLLQLGALNVLTDPIWSERASPFRVIGPRRLMAPGVAFDALPPIDLVLLSHNHYDHLDSHTVRRIAGRCPDVPWLCPMGLGELLGRFGVRTPIECEWWESVDRAAFRATCTPAQHFSARGFRDRNQTLWCGWTLAADGVAVYFAGDTGLHPEFGAIGARLGPFDLIMLPIGAYEPRWFMRTIHMDPDEAVQAYRALTTRDACPPCLALHWGTFRLTDEPVGEPPARFAQYWRDAGLPGGHAWIFAHGETRQLRA